MDIGVEHVSTSSESQVVGHQSEHAPHGHQVTEFAFETIIRRGVLAQKDGPMHVRVGRQGATDRIAFLIHWDENGRRGLMAVPDVVHGIGNPVFRHTEFKGEDTTGYPQRVDQPLDLIGTPDREQFSGLSLGPLDGQYGTSGERADKEAVQVQHGRPKYSADLNLLEGSTRVC